MTQTNEGGPCEAHTTWRPYRWTIIAGVLLLAAAPAVFGLSLIKDWRYAPVFPLFLIAFGPVTVLSVFVALRPFLEGWWLRRQSGARKHK